MYFFKKIYNLTFHKFKNSAFATESSNALKVSLRNKKLKSSSIILESLKDDNFKQEVGMMDESKLLDDVI